MKINLITAESAADAYDASDDDDDDDDATDANDANDDNNSDGKDVVEMYVDVNTKMYIHKKLKHVPTCINNHTRVNVIIFRNVLSLLRRTFATQKGSLNHAIKESSLLIRVQTVLHPGQV